jgi:hypothetical protein
MPSAKTTAGIIRSDLLVIVVISPVFLEILGVEADRSGRTLRAIVGAETVVAVCWGSCNDL